MKTRSIRPLPVVAFALALACVAMVPVAHAGVRVWADDSWEAAPAGQTAEEAYCRSQVSTNGDYRPRVVLRYVIIHPRELSGISVVSRRYVMQRVEAGELTPGVLRTVAPAPPRVRPTDRSRVVSTSRTVSQVKRASFEAKREGRSVSSSGPKKESAKQQGDPVKVASKSAK